MVSLNLVPATPESTKYRLDWLSHFSLFMCRGFRFQTPWCQNLSKEILQTDLFIQWKIPRPLVKMQYFIAKLWH